VKETGAAANYEVNDQGRAIKREAREKIFEKEGGGVAIRRDTGEKTNKRKGGHRDRRKRKGL